MSDEIIRDLHQAGKLKELAFTAIESVDLQLDRESLLCCLKAVLAVDAIRIPEFYNRQVAMALTPLAPDLLQQVLAGFRSSGRVAEFMTLPLPFQDVDVKDAVDGLVFFCSRGDFVGASMLLSAMGSPAIEVTKFALNLGLKSDRFYYLALSHMTGGMKGLSVDLAVSMAGFYESRGCASLALRTLLQVCSVDEAPVPLKQAMLGLALQAGENELVRRLVVSLVGEPIRDGRFATSLVRGLIYADRTQGMDALLEQLVLRHLVSGELAYFLVSRQLISIEQCQFLMKGAQVDDYGRALLNFSCYVLMKSRLQWNDASGYLEEGNRLLSKVYREFSSSYRRVDVENLFEQLVSASVSGSRSKVSAAGRPIFIVGMPRSGTSVMERILCNALGCSSVGESDALERVAELYRELLATSESIGEFEFAWLRDYYRFVAGKESESEVFIDKMPHNFQHVGMLLKIFPEARVIQLRRRKADVCWSVFERPFPVGHSYSTDLYDISHFYDQVYRLMDSWASADELRVKDFLFDDIAEGSEQLQSLIQWLDASVEFGGVDLSGTSFTFSDSQMIGGLVAHKEKAKSEYGKYQSAMEAIAKEH